MLFDFLFRQNEKVYADCRKPSVFEESIASAANSRAQDLEDETSRLRDSLNDRALVADTATAEDLVR